MLYLSIAKIEPHVKYSQKLRHFSKYKYHLFQNVLVNANPNTNVWCYHIFLVKGVRREGRFCFARVKCVGETPV